MGEEESDTKSDDWDFGIMGRFQRFGDFCWSLSKFCFFFFFDIFSLFLCFVFNA